MSGDEQTALRQLTQAARVRAGQLLGLLFLVGPVADLSDEAGAPTAAIVVALIAFVALYLALLPPVRPLARAGPSALRAGLGLLAALAGATLALGAPQSFVLLFVYVVAAAGLLLPPRLAWVVTGVTAAGVAAGLVATDAHSSAVTAYTLSVLAIGALMTAFGTTMRTNRELREARDELARLAVSEERLRIARDLHDLLGHTLSVIALKSDLAARLVRSDPRRAEDELADVGRVTRAALTEVREAVQGYRHVAFPDALRNAHAALSAAGIDCRVDTAAAELPPDVESVLAWAVREATTNVVRHSGAHACAITVSTDREAVALEVQDDGTGAREEDGDGTGLAGLAERARGLHGTLEAGGRPEGGYRLRLELPLRAA